MVWWPVCASSILIPSIRSRVWSKPPPRICRSAWLPPVPLRLISTPVNCWSKSATFTAALFFISEDVITVTNNIRASVGHLLLGSYFIGSLQLDPFKGKMDEVRIYHKVLSESEILELYYEGGYGLYVRWRSEERARPLQARYRASQQKAWWIVRARSLRGRTVSGQFGVRR